MEDRNGKDLVPKTNGKDYTSPINSWNKMNSFFENFRGHLSMYP